MNWYNSIITRISNMWTRQSHIEKYGKDWWYGTGMADTWDEFAFLEAFNTLPELNAIINLKARAFSNGVIKYVNDKGEALDHPFLKLLKKPNWFQSQKEFLRQTKLGHEVFGNEYLYFLMPFGFDNIERTKALYTLPPHLTKAYYRDSAPFYSHAEQPKTIEYIVDSNGAKTSIPTSLILHLNDNRLDIKSVTDKDLLQGESKMVGLTPAINNITMAYESRGVILKYRGALGILSNASTDSGVSVPLRPGEKKKVQDAYKQYGGLSHQQSVIITSANLKWQQMSVNPDKLGLFQECEEDFNKMLDAYGPPAEMFVRSKGATYENRKQAEKGMYQNTIIPEACEWIGGINAKVNEGGKGSFIMDYSHLPIFQEDLKLRGEALEKMVNSLSKMLADGAITIEEYKAELQKFGIAKTN